MTNHNSIQNTSATGVNHSAKTVLSARQYENISSLEQLNKSNEIFQEVFYFIRLMSGYHQFIKDCLLTHPDLNDFTLSVEAIQLDIDKRLNSILQLVTSS
ncbi:hypothetical protein MTZ49_12190 [Entomomonas sp. E2T0]|uniref:hypothetical protein n=1 Tax=Entomomonas sp. E2T0 TaxID=2930213 RepID=UPI00222847AA|nr:hypothetical protein [Entomomonas sp. E2T0]UYZ83346.1 hypothetical protein MTZ49_12175 [Entomomonas sp. E2T0]UYZ83349.1 hypothetical protein MTZ49_12190 [Entomomonas sp. E2T0]